MSVEAKPCDEDVCSELEECNLNLQLETTCDVPVAGPSKPSGSAPKARLDKTPSKSGDDGHSSKETPHGSPVIHATPVKPSSSAMTAVTTPTHRHTPGKAALGRTPSSQTRFSSPQSTKSPRRIQTILLESPSGKTAAPSSPGPSTSSGDSKG